MRTLILATASAIALGIAGAGPLYAQTAHTDSNGTATKPAPAAGQKATQPAAPQPGTRMEQGTALMSGANQYNSPALAGTSASGNWGQTSQNGWLHGWRQHAFRSDVRQVQHRLRAEGLYRGGIDGIDGPETRQALRQFQHQNGLRVNGRIDRQTMASLLGNGTGYGSTMPANNANGINMPPASNAGAHTNTPATR